MGNDRKPRAGNHADSVTEPESGRESSKRETRRRIIKAAAGAPIMFTLPGGTALAAASLWCADNSADSADLNPPLNVTSGSDQWVRVRLQKYDIPQPGNNVGGFQLDLNGEIVWYQVHSDGTASIISLQGSGMGGTQPSEVEGEYYYALVDYTSGDFYPRTGYYEGYVDNPIAGASCWNSLTGSTLTSNVIELIQ